MSLIRKLLALLLSIPILVVGIILIPLPGPGLLICFIGLFILSFEFQFAHKYIEQIKMVFRRIYKEAKERADRIEKGK